MDHLPFIRAIAERDDSDPGPHLIYADFLDECDDPRGELIRVQLALESMPGTDPAFAALKRREGGLIQACLPKWIGELKHLGGGIELHRGLPEAITMEAKIFIARGSEAFDLAPIRHVRFLDIGNRLPALLAHPAARSLRAMTIFAQYLGERIGTAFLGAPDLPRLRSLYLGRNNLGDSGVEVLSRCGSLAGLRWLDIGENRVGDLGLSALSRANFSNLGGIESFDNLSTLDGLETILRSGSLSMLEYVGMSRNRSMESRPSPVGESQSQPRDRDGRSTVARVLDLRENQIGPSVAETMAAREVFSCVRSVDFGYNALQDEGIGRLCASSWLPGIRQLTLTDNRIGDDGLIELAAHPRPLALETLDLARGSISDAGTRAILHSRCLGELRRIRLPVASLSERMFRLFREQYPVLAENGWFCRTTTEEPTR